MMGDVIVLADRSLERETVARFNRASHHRRLRAAGHHTFFFDLACPFSYLAAERVERMLGEVQWIPGAGATLMVDMPQSSLEDVRACAERRALELRLPLIWPERFPAAVPRALRAAARAAELGAGAGFALAASRLAFCGGFDLEDPEILAECAAAGGVPLEECLEASGESRRDRVLRATAERLIGRGVRRLPAFRVYGHWFDGEERLVEAAALLRARGLVQRPSVRTASVASLDRPLAPMG